MREVETTGETQLTQMNHRRNTTKHTEHGNTRLSKKKTGNMVRRRHNSTNLTREFGTHRHEIHDRLGKQKGIQGEEHGYS